jgi:four helix bundle protein
MAKAERFEDLVAWQRARQFTRQIYQITRHGDFARDHGLSNQMQRAAVSIMANIAEGFERGNRGDFGRFLQIAKASCGEVRSQLYIALDVKYITQAEFQSLHQNALEVSRLIGGLLASVKRGHPHEPNP